VLKHSSSVFQYKFDTDTQQCQSISRIEQKGESVTPTDQKFVPYFTAIRVANDKFLLLNVATAASGKDNCYVLAVNLNDRHRSEIEVFTLRGRVLAHSVCRLDRRVRTICSKLIPKRPI
jgi:hypothetical protein